jgi:hypothetical protein
MTKAASLVVWRTLVPVPLLVTPAVARVLAPARVTLVAGDIGQRRMVGFRAHVAVIVARFGHCPSVPAPAEVL